MLRLTHEELATTLRRVEGPATEPVAVDEAREHARIDHEDEDDWIEGRIQGWREQTEKATQRALITQTWDLTLWRFPDRRAPIRLHRPPVQSITSVAYVDGAGDNQTLDVGTQVVLVKDEPALLYPAPGLRWPSVQRDNPHAVTVRFVAGYGAAESVPQSLRAAILLGVATRHEHREDVVVGSIISQFRAIDAIWDQYGWDSGVR